MSGTHVYLVPAILLLTHRTFGQLAGGAWALNGVAALMGVFAGSYWFDRQVFPRMTARQWRRQLAFGWSFRIGTWMLLGVAIAAMPAEPGWSMAAVAAAFLATYLALMCGLAVPLLRWMGALSAPSERLVGIVDGVSNRMGVRPSALWSMQGLHAAAFALPTRCELIVSDRLMEVCNDQEVAAVCAHELGHLQESKVAVAGRIFGSLALVPAIFLRPAFHEFGSSGLLAVAACMLIIMRFSKWLSRRLERRADRAACAESSEGDFARALERIYRENQIPAVTWSRGDTHPHLYDRMVAAGVTPDFPRPAAPTTILPIAALFWAVLGVLIGIQLAWNGFLER
jgi:Zn-dependent protease with chaperone function